MQNCLSQYGVRFVELALSQFHEDHIIKHVVAVASDLMDKVIQNELSAPSRSKPRSASPVSCAHCGLAMVSRNVSWVRVIASGGGQNLDLSPTNFKNK